MALKIDIDKFLFFLPEVRKRIEKETFGVFSIETNDLEENKHRKDEEENVIKEIYDIHINSFKSSGNRIKSKRRIKSTSHKDDDKLMVNFCIGLLQNADTNPSIIRWFNEKELVFKIENPDDMAKLWGKKKGNGKMNYDKMSRAIRYGRTSGDFTIPEKSLYKTQYVHQFGARAISRNEWLQSLRSKD